MGWQYYIRKSQEYRYTYIYINNEYLKYIKYSELFGVFFKLFMLSFLLNCKNTIFVILLIICKGRKHEYGFHQELVCQALN